MKNSISALIIGCGFAGKVIAEHLQQKGISLFLTTTHLQNCASLSTYGTPLVCRSDQIEILRQALERVTTVIITVAPSSSSVEDYQNCYLKTAQTLFDYCQTASTLEQVIFTSSTSVYGDAQGSFVDEGSQPQSLNQTASILLQTEELLRSIRTPPNVCVFRLGEIYGKGRSPLQRLQQNSSFPGAGENFCNFTHVEDIAKAVAFAMEKSLSGVYNLCQKDHPTRRALYEKLCRKYHLPLPVWDPYKPSPHGGHKRVKSDKIESVGFQFEHKYFDE